MQNQNPNSPAYPDGVSIRDYFASRAPGVSMNWYEMMRHKEGFRDSDCPFPLPGGRIGFMKDLGVPVDDLDEFISWYKDPIYDLPDHLQQYGEKLESIKKQRKEWFILKDTELRTMWAYYWADRMIEARKQ